MLDAKHTRTTPLFRLVDRAMWPRLVRLARLGSAQRLVVAGKEDPFRAAHWIVTSASDATLAHEVTILAGTALSASCDCEGWQLSGACKHVALSLREARLGPWEEERPKTVRQGDVIVTAETLEVARRDFQDARRELEDMRLWGCTEHEIERHQRVIERTRAAYERERAIWEGASA